MATAIVSDSNAALPNEAARGLPVYFAPLEIRLDGRTYLDGVDLAPADFYAALRSGGALPTTSAPTPAAFLDAFRRASAEADEAVCVTLSAELSAARASAGEAVRLAERELPGFRVTLTDSRSAGPAQSLIVLDAARLAASGAPAPALRERVEKRTRDTFLLGYLSTLRHLSRSGRVPRIVAWAGGALGVKPVLHLTEGRIGLLERPRTEGKALARLAAVAGERLAGRPARAAVAHADAPESAASLAERLRAGMDVEEMFVIELTPAIGAHTGPGLVACALQPVEA